MKQSTSRDTKNIDSLLGAVEVNIITWKHQTRYFSHKNNFIIGWSSSWKWRLWQYLWMRRTRPRSSKSHVRYDWKNLSWNGNVMHNVWNFLSNNLWTLVHLRWNLLWGVRILLLVSFQATNSKNNSEHKIVLYKTTVKTINHNATINSISFYSLGY